MKIVVLGGGFAGVAAAKKLCRLVKDKSVEIILIDKNTYTTMLPALPDVAGGSIRKRALIEDIKRLIPERVIYINKNVQKVNLLTRQIVTDKGTIFYDYLVIASGSNTNFYGFNQNLDKLYTLSSLEDSQRILNDFTKALQTEKDINLVVSGAGFTGIELACSLNRLALKHGRKIHVFLIEKAEHILAALSSTMLHEVESETNRLGFKIIKNDYVTEFDGNTVYLKNNGQIPNAFFCWCSGVKSSIPVEGNLNKLFDERIIVDENLRVPQHPEVFAVGDAAAFMDKGAYLRRSVNYAVMMGSLAAKNISNIIYNRKLQSFKPFDPGWVIPVNTTSIGEAFGHGIKGRLGILLHYIICGVKNYNFSNFLSFCVSAFKFAFIEKK